MCVANVREAEPSLSSYRSRFQTDAVTAWSRVASSNDWQLDMTAKPGTHSILTPDYSHKLISTEGYAAATPGMVGNDVWFPIGINASLQNSSRYVHVGNLSEGCVTVYQLERWSALYTYLISHRVPGSAGKRVGSLVVHG